MNNNNMNHENIVNNKNPPLLTTRTMATKLPTSWTSPTRLTLMRQSPMNLMASSTWTRTTTMLSKLFHNQAFCLPWNPQRSPTSTTFFPVSLSSAGLHLFLRQLSCRRLSRRCTSTMRISLPLWKQHPTTLKSPPTRMRKTPWTSTTRSLTFPSTPRTCFLMEQTMSS